MIVVVMGVAGSGKTTVGEALSRQAGWPFLDADAFHSPENVEKMRRGEGLTEAERAPWLARLREALQGVKSRGESVVLACSALKCAHRETLQVGGVRFVYLWVAPEVLRARLEGRRNHYAGPGLLQSQLAALEEPSREEALRVEASGAETPSDLASDIRRELGIPHC